MTRFKLIIEYDGRGFVGWQRQAHGASIQQALEEAVAATTGEESLVQGAGRTDAGVHAQAMAAHVDIAKPIRAFRLREALNAHLRPLAIAVRDCQAVADDWHARFSCVKRVYEYRIINRRAPLTWQRGLYWQVAQPLDSSAMHRAAQVLVGRYDFTTFRSAHCQARSATKSLDRLDVTAMAVDLDSSGDSSGDSSDSSDDSDDMSDRETHITIRAEARSFLHHQVRSMVGCLVLVGRGAWSIDDLQTARDACNRQTLGLNAPADGLYFVAAHYVTR